MRYFFSFILLSSLLILSCRSDKKQPEGILPEKKLRVVLWDMMRADQFLTDFVFSRDTSLNKLNESMLVYNRIFAIHRVTKEEFQQSFRYYKEQPGLLKGLLDSVAAFNIPPVVTTVTDTAKPPATAPKIPRRDSLKFRKLKME